MKFKPIVLFSLLVIAIVFTTQAVMTQEKPAPGPQVDPALTSKEFPGDHNQRPGNLHGAPREEMRSQKTPRIAPNGAVYTSNPDAFGYVWEDEIPYSWPDATQGSRTNITGDEAYGNVELGFAFPFYEQNWGRAYVSTNGFLSFGDGTSGCCGGYPIPMWRYPNNVIAPFWGDLDIDPDDGGGIWVLRRGSEPNRSIVIEWHNVYSWRYGDYVTFAVELHEDGEIFVYYEDLGGADWAGSVGIEDSTGTVGLQFYDAYSFSALAFHPPAPSRGALVHLPRYGEFSAAGAAETFEFQVRNFGRLGTDTFDIDVNSAWPAQVSEYGGGALSDSNGNGKPDTGPLAQGEDIILEITITTPSGAAEGESNEARVTATSTADVNKNSTGVFETTVAAPHAQAIIDDQDYAMGLNLLQPAGQRRANVSAMNQSGYDPAIAELPEGGFVYVWSRAWATTPNYQYKGNLFIALTDRYGALTHNVKIPFDAGREYAGVQPTSAYEWDSTVKVAPNGNIGVFWQRYLYNSEIGRINYNVFFALLDKDGNVLSGPKNISNNTSWAEWGTEDYRWIAYPSIAATGDGRFVLAWLQQRPTNEGWWYSDIYYAVAGNDGSILSSAEQITTGPDGDYWSFYPSVATAPNNRATIFYEYEYYENENDNGDGVYYATVNAQGGLDETREVLAPNTSVSDNIDAALLSNGHTMVVWSAWEELGYAVLGPQQTVTVEKKYLFDSLNSNYEGAVNASVASAGDGKAVVTWSDSYNLSIYYALLNSSGAVLTEPQMTYQGRDYYYPYVNSGYNGNGTTSYSWQPPSASDVSVKFPLPVAGGLSGQEVAVPVNVSNLGQAKADGIKLELVLDSGLTYTGDDSGITPVVDGSKVSWDLPDLFLLQSQKFNVRLEIPAGAALGDTYNVNATVSSSSSDAVGGNNTAAAKVVSARINYLPAVTRP